MKSWNGKEELLHQATLLCRQGMTRRAIARALGVGRNTVRKLLARHEQDRDTPRLALATQPVRAARPSKLDGHHEKVHALLERFPEMTAQRVFEELKGQGFTGGYTAVKKFVRKVRPKPKPVVSLPTPVHGPGKMAECDWSPYTIDFTHAPRRTLQGFAYALTHSHRKFFRFYPRSDLYALMDGHVQVFTAFQGAAERCKYDCQKAVVLRWEGHQPIYNPRFIDIATYYEFQPVACRPGHPNDKPRVERSFWELERSFFNGRQFRDEADLSAQLAWWQANVCDVRLHKKVRRSALDLFTEEQPFLRALPQHPYDTARVVYRLCDVEGYIAWDGNRYSLAYEHVTDILPVRITQTELFVYAADLSCIARHELRPKGAGQDVTLPEHRPATQRQGPDLDQLKVAYARIGEAATGFLTGLIVAQPRSAAYHARRILALREGYQTADLLPALAHATAFSAFDHHAVERILLARATPRRLDEYIAQATARKLEAVLGESQTEPRDLSEYDALPSWSRERTRKERLPCPETSPHDAPSETVTTCADDYAGTSIDSD